MVEKEKNWKNTVLYIVGSGPEEKCLKEKVKALQLEENVMFTG